MNEKLRRELREAQETIEELMKELEGGEFHHPPPVFFFWFERERNV